MASFRETAALLPTAIPPGEQSVEHLGSIQRLATYAHPMFQVAVHMPELKPDYKSRVGLRAR